MIPLSKPSLGAEELAAIGRVLESGWLGLGAVVREFELRVAAFLGGEGTEAVAVSSGTAALQLALEAIGLQPGDEVVVPALTFIATAQAVLAAGGCPVLCDVRADTLNLDPHALRQVLSPRTRAVIPVHYRGVPCDLEAIQEVSRPLGVRVIEDAAHAFGSALGGRRIGSFGDVTCFSFDPIKNVTCGEGGAIVTRDPVLARRVRARRNLGVEREAWARRGDARPAFPDVRERGYRLHMPNLNAAIGLVQLDKFEVNNARKLRIARMYDSAFAGLPGLRLVPTDYKELGLFAYVVRVLHGRDELLQYLRSSGVEAGTQYTPLHHFTLLAGARRGDLSVSEEAGAQVLSLPLFPDLQDTEAAHIISAVRSFFGAAAYGGTSTA